MKNVLYIIGSGSLYYNEELKYCLRALESNVPDVNTVTVVGENVPFLSDKVNHFYIEEAKGNKEYCIAMKVYNACKLGYVKGDFIFMNDDFFINTKPFDFSINYAKQELSSSGGFDYQEAVKATRLYLESLGKTTYHFDVHTPIIYNAEKFMKLLSHFEQSRLKPYGMVVKSLYGNIYGLKPTMYKDCKLNELKTPSQIKEVKTTPVISCSDSAWVHGVKSYLKTLYPIKSKYEK